MHILFLGNFLPAPLMENVVRDSRGRVSFSNHIYEWNILKSLCGREDVRLEALTVPGVGSYPKGNRHLFTASYRTEENGIPVQSVGFCNVWPYFIVSRRFNLQHLLARKLREFGSEPVEILLSAPAFYTQQALQQALKKVHPNARITAILPDVPLIMDEMASAGSLRSKALHRRAERSMKMLQECDRYILLTEQMRDFIPEGKPYLVMEGVVEMTPAAPPAGKPVIAYTGVVDRQFGLGQLIDAFLQLKTPDAELHIAGSGPMEPELRDLSRKYPSCHYYGGVTPQKAAEIRGGASVVVNPRTSEMRFTRYSFPSKTLEYLVSGKTVVAHMLPGIPEEYRPYLVVPEREEADALAAAIDTALALTPETVAERAEAARNFVRQYKTCRPQGDRILQFLAR